MSGNRGNLSRDIDVVVLWVDGNDPVWQQQRYGYSANTEESNDFIERQQGAVRFRDWGLMRYWFRGIAKFAPWVRKIHFVTCGQRPDFLNLEAERLNLVDHVHYIDEANLPTFNSNVIDMNLYRIKDLSEKFVYFNDDMFLVKETSSEFFFQHDLPCDFSVMTPINTDRIEDMFAHFLLNNCGFLNKHIDKHKAIRNNLFGYFNIKYGAGLLNNLLLSLFSQFQSFSNPHLPQAFLKSSFEAVWRLEPEFFNKISGHRFRDYTDVNQYLVRDWQLATGAFSPVGPRGRGEMVRLSDQSISAAVAAIRSPKSPMLCINDDIDISDFDSMQRQLAQAFEELLPEKCEFEL